MSYGPDLSLWFVHYSCELDDLPLVVSSLRAFRCGHSESIEPVSPVAEMIYSAAVDYESTNQFQSSGRLFARMRGNLRTARAIPKTIEQHADDIFPGASCIESAC